MFDNESTEAAISPVDMAQANFPMTDAHRMFLQGFMCQGILPARDIKNLYKNCLAQHPIPAGEASNLATFVETINVNLKPMNLELRKAISEDISATNYYGLINLAKTPITLLASDYNSNELEIFKRIIEEVVESDHGSISSINVLNMTDTVPDRKILKKDIENLLARLEREKWISVTSGQVSLSTRSLLELEQYIHTQFPDTSTDCNMCNRICVRGESCVNCDVKLHLHCASKLFPPEHDASSRKCPGCQEQWPRSGPAQLAPRPGTSASDSPPPTRRRRGMAD